MKFKILKKFLDEMVFGEVFNCAKDEKLKIKIYHVSIFGFRRMMIKRFARYFLVNLPTDDCHFWLQTKTNP